MRLALVLCLAGCLGPVESQTLTFDGDRGGPNNWLAFSVSPSPTAVNVYTRFGCDRSGDAATIESLLTTPHQAAMLPHVSTVRLEAVTVKLEPMMPPAEVGACLGTRSADGVWHWTNAEVRVPTGTTEVSLPLQATDVDAVSLFPGGAFVKSATLQLRRE
jgi:hypothetical protein